MKTPKIKFENCESIGDQIKAIVDALDNTTCGEFIASSVLKHLCVGENVTDSTKLGDELTSSLYSARQRAKCEQDPINKILEASRQNPEGFTFDLYTNDLLKIDYGYVVAIIDTQDSHVSANIPSVLRAARKHNLHLVGGWWDEKEEKYYYDACAWFEDFSEAVAFAKANNQKAIYDCEEKVVIDLRVKSC